MSGAAAAAAHYAGMATDAPELATHLDPMAYDAANVVNLEWFFRSSYPRSPTALHPHPKYSRLPDDPRWHSLTAAGFRQGTHGDSPRPDNRKASHGPWVRGQWYRFEVQTEYGEREAVYFRYGAAKVDEALLQKLRSTAGRLPWIPGRTADGKTAVFDGASGSALLAVALAHRRHVAAHESRGADQPASVGMEHAGTRLFLGAILPFAVPGTTKLDTRMLAAVAALEEVLLAMHRRVREHVLGPPAEDAAPLYMGVTCAQTAGIPGMYARLRSGATPFLHGLLTADSVSGKVRPLELPKGAAPAPYTYVPVAVAYMPPKPATAGLKGGGAASKPRGGYDQMYLVVELPKAACFAVKEKGGAAYAGLALVPVAEFERCAPAHVFERYKPCFVNGPHVDQKDRPGGKSFFDWSLFDPADPLRRWTPAEVAAHNAPGGGARGLALVLPNLNLYFAAEHGAALAFCAALVGHCTAELEAVPRSAAARMQGVAVACSVTVEHDETGTYAARQAAGARGAGLDGPYQVGSTALVLVFERRTGRYHWRQGTVASLAVVTREEAIAAAKAGGADLRLPAAALKRLLETAASGWTELAVRISSGANVANALVMAYADVRPRASRRGGGGGGGGKGGGGKGGGGPAEKKSKAINLPGDPRLCLDLSPLAELQAAKACVACGTAAAGDGSDGTTCPSSRTCWSRSRRRPAAWWCAACAPAAFALTPELWVDTADPEYAPKWWDHCAACRRQHVGENLEARDETEDPSY